MRCGWWMGGVGRKHLLGDREHTFSDTRTNIDVFRAASRLRCVDISVKGFYGEFTQARAYILAVYTYIIHKMVSHERTQSYTQQRSVFTARL